MADYPVGHCIRFALVFIVGFTYGQLSLHTYRGGREKSIAIDSIIQCKIMV